jgi:hypothetical protein
MSQVDGEKSLSTWSYLEIEALRKGE